jgi:hypothetical protein
MNEKISQAIGRNKALYAVAFLIFAVVSVTFFYIHSLSLDSTQSLRQAWGSAYQIMALFGGVVGLCISRKWGGYKSLVGKAIFFFSIGLLLQSLGQSVNSYYNYFQNQTIPYPSFGDVGFMGSVFAYIAGSVFLARATGFQLSIRSIKGKFFAIGIPLVVLVLSYSYFLQKYIFDWTNSIKIFLDFGYPFGQAFFVSMALLALIMSREYLGGVMKRPLMFIVVALMFQYISDFTFLYQANAGTWYVGGVNDFLYFISYFLMALALINMGSVFKSISTKEA